LFYVEGVALTGKIVGANCNSALSGLQIITNATHQAIAAK